MSVYVTSDSGGNARRLTEGVHCEQPAISPDGTWVVFACCRASPDEGVIAIMDVEGGRRRVVANGTDPSWAPDGALILFKSLDDDGET